MNITLGNFKLIRREHLHDISVEAFEFIHNQTKAKVVFFHNDDNHRAFGISFKTLPYNDNGISHILEHCVLAGSKKYPLKDPFFQLLKGSLQTFLNAMTYPDKTVYPVASLNKKDFSHLVDVYLDSVFNPLLKKEIFQQEGWHYELKNQKLSYSGIVFNEMKGAYSPPEHLMDYYIYKLLCKGSQYQFSSGGYPISIPSLSYEEFCQFHRENYHPSNSITFFYGNNDISHFLSYLDKKFFKYYKEKSNFPNIELVKRWKSPQEHQIYYPFIKENTERKTFLTLSFLLEEMSLDNHMSFALLSDILLRNDSSPLYKALQNSGLGESVIDDGYSSYGKQTSFHVGLRESESKNKDAFKELFLKTMKNLRDNGIEKNLIENSFSKYEFSLRELDNSSKPKGLNFFLQSSMFHLYGLDYFEYFCFEKNLEKIKSKIKDKSFFSSLIDKYFFQNKHYLLLSFIPSEKAYHQELKAFENQLSKQQSIMKEADLAIVDEQKKSLTKLQNTPDNQEALQKLPSLSLKDLNKSTEIVNEEWYSVQETESPLFYHPYQCNKISYIQFVFNVSDFSEQELLYLEIFSLLLKKIGTKGKSYNSLIEEITFSFGRLSSYTEFFYNQSKKLEARFLLDFAIVDNKYDLSFSLLAKIIRDIDFANKERIFTVLSAKKSELHSFLTQNGHSLSYSFLASSLNSLGSIKHKSSFYFLYQFLSDILIDFDSKFSELQDNLLSLKNKIFNLNRCLFNLVGEDKVNFSRYIPIILEVLSVKKYSQSSLVIEPEDPCRLAILTTSTVQYVSYGSIIEPTRGDFLVLKRALTVNYLLENIRLKGGAYGCFCHYNNNDNSLILTSYRDPHLKNTLKTFQNLPNFLRDLSMSKKEFLRLLIGSIGALDSPLSQYNKGIKSLQMYWQGRQWSDLQQEREEVLSTSLDAIKSYIQVFEDFTQESRYAIFGSSKKINENNSLFDKFIKLE